MAKKSVLGKGLTALLDSIDEEVINNEVVFIDLSDIEPQKSQPRKYFNEDTILSLAESIKKHGVLQPILVSKNNNKYIIIAGERRFRAAKKAGLNEIPAIIKENIDEITSFEISLIENLQREDLNPLEEAESYKNLVDAFNYTHEKIAKLVGKDRTYITNSIRLLKLSDFVKEQLIKKNISTGHAKILVTLPEKKQIELTELVIEKGLTVRELEKIVSVNKKPERKREIIFFPEETKKLSKKFNTKVDIKINKKDKGRIVIYFKNREEFEKLLKDLIWC